SGGRRYLGRGTAGRFAGKPSAQGEKSGIGPGGSGEARSRHRAHSHGGDSGFKANTVIGLLKQNVAPGSTIFTDGLKSFDGLKEAGYQHVSRIQPLRIELRK